MYLTLDACISLLGRRKKKEIFSVCGIHYKGFKWIKPWLGLFLRPYLSPSVYECRDLACKAQVNEINGKKVTTQYILN